MQLTRSTLAAHALLALPLLALPLLALTPGALALGVEEEKLTDAGGAADDRYGRACDIDGDFAAIGAANNGLGGAAFFYQRIGGVWTLEDELAAGDATDGGWFGGAIAISGTTVVVGAKDAEDTLGVFPGAVYVFDRSGGTWTETVKLTASDLADGDDFGATVAIEGDTIVVGAPFKFGAMGGEGAAYVFTRDGGGNWSQQAKLEAGDAGFFDWFGWDVSVSGDLALIGTPFDANIGSASGSAYVFLRTGTSWAQEQKLQAADAADGDQFGGSVTISGQTLACGSLLDDDLGDASGSAYVFDRLGTNWSQVQKLNASDGALDDLFGGDIAMRGSKLVVGAFHTSLTNPAPGAAYLFEFDGVNWVEDAILLGSDSVDENWFGDGVNLDGTRVIIGAQQANEMKGAAYVFAVDAPISGFCFGDGSGSPCPCGNPSALDSGEGCANSTGVGGRLTMTGSTSVASDDLGFNAQNLVPGQPGLLFVGENSINGGDGVPFGDGLRCAGMNVVRLGVDVPDGAGNASWGPGLGAQGGWAPGDTRFFQAWYRDPSNGPCGLTFNLSNGVQVAFSN